MLYVIFSAVESAFVFMMSFVFHMYTVICHCVMLVEIINI